MPPFLVKKELKKWKRSWKIGLSECRAARGRMTGSASNQKT